MGKGNGEKKAKKKGEGKKQKKGSVRDLVRVGPGFSLTNIDAERLVGGPDNESDARKETRSLEAEASDLHTRLWAESLRGGKRSLLVVVQGMDTSGKGGAGKALDRLLIPLGFSIVGFGPPTAEEKAHPFLWRHEIALPEHGRVRMFDRSHYEAVLIERVRGFAKKSEWSKRYDEINAWEKRRVDAGTTVLKCMLHISKDEQKRRFTERLEDPTKYWKYNPGDLRDREHWDEYMAAYQDALVKCSTEHAPWYVVPANHKWHRDWLLAHLLLETLREMAPEYPKADFDVEAERALVAAL